MAHEFTLLGRCYEADPVRRNRLVDLLKNGQGLVVGLDQMLATEQHRAEGEWKKSDFLWRGTVRAIMTVRGSHFYERIMDRDDWSFERLISLSARQRDTFFQGLVHGKSPDNWRAKRLRENFAILAESGSLEREQNLLRTLTGWQEKVGYFGHGFGKVLKGFGPKYARNFWLDFADPEVSTACFAIDSRIQGVLTTIWRNYDGANDQLKKALSRAGEYQKIELVLLAIANEAGITAWQADRTLYRLLVSTSKNAVLRWLRDGGPFPPIELNLLNGNSRPVCK